MRLIVILMFLFSLSQADDKSTLFKLYNQGHYEEVCEKGFKLFRHNRNDEAFIALYAYACLNADSLDRLATPIVMLKRSKDARANAAYFSAILIKKKLLYHALLDDFDVQNIKLPASSHILSKVFDIFASKKQLPVNGIYQLLDPNESEVFYQLYLDRKESLPKIVIEEYKNSILQHRHIYW